MSAFTIACREISGCILKGFYIWEVFCLLSFHNCVYSSVAWIAPRDPTYDFFLQISLLLALLMHITVFLGRGYCFILAAGKFIWLCWWHLCLWHMLFLSNLVCSHIISISPPEQTWNSHKLLMDNHYISFQITILL